jgi:predicted nucleic acid-binding protein
MHWLSALFSETWIPSAVALELEEGKRRGYDVPDPTEYPWIRTVDPHAVPSEWLTLDLGPGELATMALALENPGEVVLLDDALARRIAGAAGLRARGTLSLLLEAKSMGLADAVGPFDLKSRVLAMADENN